MRRPFLLFPAASAIFALLSIAHKSRAINLQQGQQVKVQRRDNKNQDMGNNYNRLQCDSWISFAFDADGNSSGGLDPSEFYALLNHISEGYFDIDLQDENGILRTSLQEMFYRFQDGAKESAAPSAKSGKEFTAEKNYNSKASKIFKGKTGKNYSYNVTGMPYQGTSNTDNTGNAYNRDEISVLGFGKKQRERSRVEKKYRHKFCNMLYHGLQDEGVDLNEGGLDTGTESTISTSQLESTSFTSSTKASGFSSATDRTPSTVDGTESNEGSTKASGDNAMTTATSASIGSETNTTVSPGNGKTPTTTKPTAITTGYGTAQATTPINQYDNRYISSFVGSTENSFVAVDVMDEVGNTILQDVTLAFWKVSIDVLGALGIDSSEDRIGAGDENSNAAVAVGRYSDQDGERRLEMSNEFIGEEVSFLFESVESDVEDVDCPDGVGYAPPDASCLRFTFYLVPLDAGPLTPAIMEAYIVNMESAINDGDLYKALIEINPNTELVGLGNPGDGIPYNPPSKVIGIEDGDNATSNNGGVLSVGGIVGIVVAVTVLIAIGIIAHRRIYAEDRRVSEFAEDELTNGDLEASSVNKDALGMDSGEEDNTAEMAPDQEVGRDDSKSHASSNSSVENESTEDFELILEDTTTPGSTLAAMGVASTVTSHLTNSPVNSSSGKEVWL